VFQNIIQRKILGLNKEKYRETGENYTVMDAFRNLQLSGISSPGNVASMEKMRNEYSNIVRKMKGRDHL
jgi:hypothetical protein